ncbi:hypothetical protein KDJ56_17895 [Brevibacillus composti]|uniref:Uncharacterized protein n=1 Tax=Brevibacillus composti TaxID=2796470 RepID=A0A7T5EJG6_9BACL|nr:hypothetical protein [Brevibacillus composti]QQE73746.1 hypothetical protein JD108_17955 [Brevibacillus composti]QUO40829.1 hypothetical protein KDJ56_17895 [Brevibacillus composti]
MKKTIDTPEELQLGSLKTYFLALTRFFSKRPKPPWVQNPMSYTKKTWELMEERFCYTGIDPGRGFPAIDGG